MLHDSLLGSMENTVRVEAPELAAKESHGGVLERPPCLGGVCPGSDVPGEAPPPPPERALLRSHVLSLGRSYRFLTSPDDVEPGHCLRFAFDLPAPSRLIVDVQRVDEALLAAVFVSEAALGSCPRAETALTNVDVMAAETAPSRSGYVSLAACVPRAGRWHVYASGPPDRVALFNVSARAGAACMSAARLDAHEPGPLTPIAALGWLSVGVGALVLLAVLAWTLARRNQRSKYTEV